MRVPAAAAAARPPLAARCRTSQPPQLVRQQPGSRWCRASNPAASASPTHNAVLSLRLGCGKGGLRMAPDELIGSFLQVPLGSVTPLAVAQPSAAGVVLMLDASLQQQQRICVHPLDNRTTTVVSPAGLEAFLRCAGAGVRAMRGRLGAAGRGDATRHLRVPPRLLPWRPSAGRWGGRRCGWTLQQSPRSTRTIRLI